MQIKIRLKIDELIKESGMTQRFVAKKIGVNENTLRNWIQGRSFPRLDQAVKLADLLECKVDDLYERK